MTNAKRTAALVFGPNGQVGSALSTRLGSLMPLIPVDRGLVDLRNISAIQEIIGRTRPSVIINAAAYTAVDAAESDESSANAINAEAPRAMAEAAAAVGAAIVHFSTDYVFDGAARTPYSEESPTNPLNVYGRSKLAGDVAVQASGAHHLIFRTSWVYSADGKNFLNAILRRAREKGALQVVNDQVGAPTSADAIADGVVAILRTVLGTDDWSAKPRENVSGIYNLTAAGSTTWYDFAHAILDRSGVTAKLSPISTAQFGAPAQRPRYSLLDGTKTFETFGVRLADWATQLDAVVGR